MKQKLDEIKTQSLKAISSAGDPATLESLRVKYLGKKGELTGLLKQMGSVSEQERPVIGRLANSIRQMIEDAISALRGNKEGPA